MTHDFWILRVSRGVLQHLSSSCSLSLTFTVRLNLIFHFHISFSPPSLLQPVWCEAGSSSPRAWSSNAPLWWRFYGKLSSGLGLNINGNQWRLSPGSKQTTAPKLVSSLAWRSFSPPGSCLPCHCLSLLSIRNSLRAAAEQPSTSHEKSWFCLIRIFWHFLEDSQRALNHFCNLDSGYDFCP